MSEFKKIELVTKLTMLKIGIKRDLDGFDYLCYAVQHVLKNNLTLFNLHKGLYVEVAKHFDVSTLDVERGIRHAINSTSENVSFDGLNELFGFLLYTIDDKPTIAELIRLVAEVYRLQLYKKFFDVDNLDV